MDCLPAETLAEIIWHLGALQEKDRRNNRHPWELASSWKGLSRSKLAPYATINRTWQELIERETFNSIGIDSDELPELAAMFRGTTGDRRLRSLRTLGFFHVPDPVPFLTPAQRSEVKEVQRRADEAFSGSMRVLFGLLKQWEGRLDGGGGGAAWDQGSLRLYLGSRDRESEEESTLPRFPVDGPPTGVAVMGSGPRDEPVEIRRSFSDFVMRPLPEDAPDEPVVARRPLIHVQYTGEEGLPDLRLVSSVTVDSYHGLHLKSLMQIVSRMKCLVEFRGVMFSETRNLDLIREDRKVLAQNLHLLPQSLKVFKPEFDPSDPEERTLYSVLMNPLRDHLCISIRVLTGQLRELELSELRISPAIFAGDGDGQWFADTLPGDVDRSIPNPELLNELYVAAAHAKQHMPRIESLHLVLNLEVGGYHSLLYHFESARNRKMLVLESRVTFGFSGEVAEAWGVNLDAVDTRMEYDDTIYEVLL
ncbi:hypothetical protein VE03_01415 [Pseudogymnoascus sp. 23342-1-I1]|nr:hypothetical protein VE03_01415 [Pseudogymnoascus sp. 23342-1-I1]